MARLRNLIRHLTLVAAFWAAAADVGAAGGTDPSTLAGHVVVGYQGWFGCGAEDGARGLTRWQKDGRPVVDMLPDLSEFAAANQCTMQLPDGGSAQVFASANPAIVDRHFSWMAEYGLDTAAVQRFVVNVRLERKRRFFDDVLGKVRAAAEKHGRTFFVEYDLSGARPDDIELIVADWQRLVADGLTRSPAYQRLAQRPIVGFYGLGFDGRPWVPADGAALLQRIHGVGGGAAIMLGVPAWWRTGTHDASSDPTWINVYRAAAILSPWTVGRFADDAGADAFRRNVMAPDVAWAKANGLVYLPVAFPGFSWSNLHDGAKPLNKIPRRCGLFFDRQIADIAAAGASAVFVAMFDEVNEGTAIFKVMPHADPARGAGHFVYLDADGCDLPSDFYLRKAGEAGAILGRK